MPDLVFLLRPSTGLLLCGRVFVKLFRSLSCMPDGSLVVAILLGSGALIGLVILFCVPSRLRMIGIFLRVFVTSSPMGGGTSQLIS